MIGSGDRKRIRFQFLPVPTVTECIEQSAYLSSEDGGGGYARRLTREPQSDSLIDLSSSENE